LRLSPSRQAPRCCQNQQNGCFRDYLN
jgi:hypothetical protein